MDFSTLKGKTLTGVEQKGNEIFFQTKDENFKMYHDQNCCESVDVEEIIGDLTDILDSEILLAEEVSSNDPDEKVIEERKAKYEKEKAECEQTGRTFYAWGPTPENNWKEESETWTFYKISTIKGSITIRWYGSSNGYYSESVEFEKVAI